MTISPTQLSSLEEKVRRLMGEGRFQEGLQEIRSTALLSGTSSDELAKQVAELALERGHVRPIRQVERLPPLGGDVQ
jgi:hypothetical protein